MMGRKQNKLKEKLFLIQQFDTVLRNVWINVAFQVSIQWLLEIELHNFGLSYFYSHLMEKVLLSTNGTWKWTRRAI